MIGKARRTAQQDSVLAPVAVFYLLAFGISWFGFAPAIASSLGSKHFQSAWWQGFLVFPGIGPALAAGIVRAHFLSAARRNDNAWSWLRSSFLRPVPLRWWAITVTLATGIMFLASLLSTNPNAGGTVHRISALSVLLFSALSVAANPLEEIGWRGFAQTTLQKSITGISAALIVGGLWAVWHIPLFFLSGSPVAMSNVPFWPWAAGVIPQAILLAWIYNRTGRSLATVSVFHVLSNVAGDVFYTSTATVSAVRMAAALAVLLLAGPDLGQSTAS